MNLESSRAQQTNALRPVVAIDVDGVLRIHEKEGLDQLHFLTREITYYRSEYPDLFHGKPRWDESHKISHVDTFSKEAVELILELAEDPRVDLVWATTWQHYANRYFGQALGLPHLPVAVKTLEPRESNYFHCSPAWKTSQLARQFDGRPLIWLDDNMPDRPGEDLAEQRLPEDRAFTRSYAVNPFGGITSEDRVEILAWIDQVTSAEGRAYLEMAHENKLQEQRRWMEERRLAHQISEDAVEKVLELYPDQPHFARSLAGVVRHRMGLSIPTIELHLKRHSLRGDAEELLSTLWIDGYHREEDETPTEPIELNF